MQEVGWVILTSPLQVHKMATALVRYAGSRPLYNAGFHLGRAAGSAAARFAARRIQSWWATRKSKGFLRGSRKRKRAPSARRFFHRNPTSSRVKNALDETFLFDAQFVNNLSNLIAQGPTQDDRRKQYADISGYKIHQIIKNTLAFPIVYHIAILTSKGRAQNIDTTFFTNVQEQGYQGQDFTDVLLSRLKKNSIPIYKQKWHVHYHRRFVVQQDAASAGYPHTMRKDSTIYVRKWLPIRRRYFYDEGAPTADTPDLLMIRWWEPLRDETLTGTETVAVERMDKLYFRTN